MGDTARWDGHSRVMDIVKLAATCALDGIPSSLVSRQMCGWRALSAYDGDQPGEGEEGGGQSCLTYRDDEDGRLT